MTTKRKPYVPVASSWPGHVTLDEAARQIGCTRDTLRVWAWRGMIASYKPSARRVFIPQAAIDAFIRERTRPASTTKKRVKTP